jgi:hypothetical protein
MTTAAHASLNLPMLAERIFSEEHEEECELILKEAIAAEAELDAVIERVNAKVLFHDNSRLPASAHMRALQPPEAPGRAHAGQHSPPRMQGRGNASG